MNTFHSLILFLVLFTTSTVLFTFSTVVLLLVFLAHIYQMDCGRLRKLCCSVLEKSVSFRLPSAVYHHISELGILAKPRTRRGCRAGRLHRLWITQRENSGQCLSIPSLQLPSVSPPVTETIPRAHSSSSRSEEHTSELQSRN